MTSVRLLRRTVVKMKWAYVIINLLFAILDFFLTLTGYFNFNVIFHGHLLSFFVGHSDGYLGLFWLACLAHDILILNAMLLAFHFLRKWAGRTY